MDLIAHILWGVLFFEGYGNIYLIMIFSVFPDLISFSVESIQLAFNKKGLVSYKEARKRTPAKHALLLYNYTHSLVIMVPLFFLVYFIHAPYSVYVLCIILHILFDIPSHSADHFATPFLFPLSNFKIDGLPWANKWFMIINYGLLGLLYLIKYGNI